MQTQIYPCLQTMVTGDSSSFRCFDSARVASIAPASGSRRLEPAVTACWTAALLKRAPSTASRYLMLSMLTPLSHSRTASVRRLGPIEVPSVPPSNLPSETAPHRVHLHLYSTCVVTAHRGMAGTSTRYFTIRLRTSSPPIPQPW